MSFFVLKIFALLAMLADHVAAVFGWTGWNVFPFDTNLWRCVGRLSFPIFAYGIVNGWKYTKNRERYFQNLCLCAAVSQVPFSLAFYPPNTMHTIDDGSGFRFFLQPPILIAGLICIGVYWIVIAGRKKTSSLLALSAACAVPMVLLKVNHVWVLADNLNVLYTFQAGLSLFYLLETVKSGSAPKLILTGCAVCAGLLIYAYPADYGIGFSGILLLAGLYFTFPNRYLQSGVIFLWGIYTYGILLGNWSYALWVLVPAVLILFCSDKQGTHTVWAKRLFYWFYPLHLFFLGLGNIFIKTLV